MNYPPIPAHGQIETVAPPFSPATPLEAEEDVLATDAEQDMTSALAALKRRGQRAVTAVQSAITPRHLAIGAGVVVALGLLWLAARRPRKRASPPSIANAIARSLFREAAGRLVLGAAAAAGARLAEAAVPVLVATISAQQAQRRHATRARKPKVSGPASAAQRSE